jgi:endonuclease YncB( thermonuclease family)
MTKKQSFLMAGVVLVALCTAAVFLFQNIPKNIVLPQALTLLAPWKNIVPSFSNPSSDQLFWVKRVVDGDTLELENGEKVRYIGINTPESVDPRRKVECFGKEASEYNKALVEGKSVHLKRDISERDKYQRLLRFVYLEDGTFINEKLVRDGYASVSTYPPDVAKQDTFRTAEQEAKSEQRGLWSAATCNGKK